jgi:anaerobic selenocysteine-containing dehydrogenase
VNVADGRLTEVTGDPDQPFTQGVICGKVRAYAERVHSPLRVLWPLRRTGPKGSGRFERITWDQAVVEITTRWQSIIAHHGAEAILPFSYAGTMGQVQFYAGHPLFHALGASLLDRTICVSTAYAGWRATLGAVTGNDSEQMVGADLVVLWGINAAYSSVNVMTLVKQARARGARVIAIDPYRTPTAHQADEHLMVRPGTDAALALAVMHVLIEEGRTDREYVARATLGFERLAEHVKPYAPAAVADVVGLPAERIAAFARAYGASPRTFIRVASGSASRQRRDDLPHARLLARPHRRVCRCARRGPALHGSGLRLRPGRAPASGSAAAPGAPDHQHDPAGPRPHRSRHGPAGPRALRLQLQSRCGLPSPDIGSPGAGPRGPLHSRP